jgi:hypothetical protein
VLPVVQAERAIIDGWAARTSTRPRLSTERLDRYLSTLPITLNAGQLRALHERCDTASGMHVRTALPGAGKTTVDGVFARFLIAEGYKQGARRRVAAAAGAGGGALMLADSVGGSERAHPPRQLIEHADRVPERPRPVRASARAPGERS